MRSVEWSNGRLRILDQTRLPAEESYLKLSNCPEVARAISEMKVRGAPAIGVVAAYGIALEAQVIEAANRTAFIAELHRAAGLLTSTRPTAANLFRAAQRMLAAAERESDISAIRTALVREAQAIHASEEEATRLISRFGAELIGDGSAVLTHCNAGGLATAGRYGTALGIVKAAHEQGKRIRVFATETRPLLQGARLTAWELMQEAIPVTLITDSMAGYFMSRGEISCVIVGADRIAANGDTANKIGTYTLAVLAKENGIPFYVAAPNTTIDLSLASGAEIPIEQRDRSEVTHIQGAQIAPEGVEVMNPAFDVTPHRYVTAIITDQGVFYQPFELNLKARDEYE